MEIESLIEDVGFNLLKLAVIRLPSDVKEALQKAYEAETSEAGKVNLKAILTNIEFAEKLNTPIC